MKISSQHIWLETQRDENDNRIRTKEECMHCRDWRFSCEAKRLGSDGGEYWGSVGFKHYSWTLVSCRARTVFSNLLDLASES